MWEPCWEFLVVFSCTWLLTHGRGQDEAQVTITNATFCNNTLNECWKLPPLGSHGIPSNAQDLEKACTAFNTAMSCLENWSKLCQTKEDREKWQSSVVGAQKTYKFLCSDKKFQRDFLRHSECHKKVSTYWDECARKFISSLRRVDHSKDTRSLCCIRYRYRHCMADAVNHFCSKNSTKFLLTMADSLVQENPQSIHPAECTNIPEKSCSSNSGAVSSLQSSTKFLSPSFLFRTILSYPAKGLVNSLNVLQNLAFTDITTFFWTLSREFSPYFRYHPHVNSLEKEYAACSHTTYSLTNIGDNKNEDMPDTNNLVRET